MLWALGSLAAAAIGVEQAPWDRGSTLMVLVAGILLMAWFCVDTANRAGIGQVAQLAIVVAVVAATPLAISLGLPEVRFNLGRYRSRGG